MTKQQQAPEAQNESAGAKFTVHYKDTKISLSRLQFLIFSSLSNGNRYSSHQLMQRCKTSDPRKEVQYLRDKGINVRDEWIAKCGEIPRHKRYWIDPEEVGDVRQDKDMY